MCLYLIVEEELSLKCLILILLLDEPKAIFSNLISFLEFSLNFLKLFNNIL